MAQAPTTWILTGSPENFAATREHGFGLVGFKERRRRMALDVEVGDRVVFYLTRVGRFGASVRVTSGVVEDRTPVWPGKPGSPDPYPWRVETEPEVVLDEEDWVDAEAVKDDARARAQVARRALAARVPGPAAHGLRARRRRAARGAARRRRRPGMSAPARVGRAWRRLEPDQRLAALAAVLLLLSMLLPWYHETGNAIVDGKLASLADSKNAFQVYSFVEASIFLVAARRPGPPVRPRGAQGLPPPRRRRDGRARPPACG